MHPSPFCNVHKSELTFLDGSIEYSNSDKKWKISDTTCRKNDLVKLQEFQKGSSNELSENTKHLKSLDFMAENGLRQLGESRIGIFADRIKPDPLHLEINNWTHCLNVLYFEATRRNRFVEFCKILKVPAKHSFDSIVGIGLIFIGKMYEEHYLVEDNRLKTPSIRIIGSQAISIAQYGYCLVDVSKHDKESKQEKVIRLILAQIFTTLQDIGSVINIVDVVEENYVENVTAVCQRYFLLFALFFPLNCNSTVCTIGYVVPFHAAEIFKDYGVGYGILSMQGKESKHSSIKQELKTCSNRSTKQGEKGKCYQLMQPSYVRNFYLPYHFSVPSIY
ncbi:uncharacterized protein LOC136096766 [Hydra vulgaris]|uniref:uncharacterized protein LOC136096766 n=1 Tax=Hydra vulgaris TaxID=6087 RepID=UPI0032E9BE94